MKRLQRTATPAPTTGFGLVELMIGLTITGIVVGGVLGMLVSIENIHHDVSNRGNAQQGTRIGMERIQRDLTMVGLGLGKLVPVYPLVAPRDDGGVELRQSGGYSSYVTEDMAGLSEVPVNSIVGASAGQTILIYDTTGYWEEFTVSGVKTVGGGSKTTHYLVAAAPLSKKYLQADGTAVSAISKTTYFVQVVDGTGMLMRQQNAEAPSPIAQGVVGFDVTYYDNSDPPAPYTPTTPVEQVRIRVLEVRLELETDVARLDTGDKESFVLSARVAPRVLMLS